MAVSRSANPPASIGRCARRAGRLGVIAGTLLIGGCATAASTSTSTAQTSTTAAQASATRPVERADPAPNASLSVPDCKGDVACLRRRWLEMFARGYFPGRSGQLFVVPRQGEIITYRDPLYRFMHGSPWDYDTRIPILFYGAPFIRQGQWPDSAVQQDIAPTLASLLGAMRAPTVTGRPLTQALAPGAARPRVIMVLVLDAMRADYFDKHADIMPTLARMKREGAWFADGRTITLPTVTGVGHATIGTGSDPRFHGITVNQLYNRATAKTQEAYAELDPRELMALTLADTWNLSTDGKAVIIGQGGAIRATAGLVGRGSCLVNARKVFAASYSTSSGGWETNPECYAMSPALASINARTMWEAAGGTWMGHDISTASRFRASSLFQRFEGGALVSVLEQSAIGADEITDLVLVNMKGPDYTAHAYGPESAELRETLGELDRQMVRVLETLDRKAGPNRSVIALTADHGMPTEPAPGHRHYPEEIVDLIHQKFDPQAKLVVQSYSDPANSQMYIDTARLQSLGFSLKDLVTMIESLEHFAAAFTEDEVRAAVATLPARK